MGCSYVFLLIIKKQKIMAKKNTTQGLGMANASKKHQCVISDILFNYRQKFNIPNIHTNIAIKKHPERVPDISIWNKYKGVYRYEPEEPILTIELIRSNQNYQYSRNSIIETLQTIPSLNEAFIYNFILDSWTRFSIDTNGNIIEEKDKDYSRTLGIYLHTLL